MVFLLFLAVMVLVSSSFLQGSCRRLRAQLVSAQLPPQRHPICAPERPSAPEQQPALDPGPETRRPNHRQPSVYSDARAGPHSGFGPLGTRRSADAPAHARPALRPDPSEPRRQVRLELELR